MSFVRFLEEIVSTEEKSVVVENIEITKDSVEQDHTVEYQQHSPWLDFLASENGSKIANQTIEAFQGLQAEGSKAQLAISKFDKAVTCVLVVVVIIAVTGLTYFDKFTPSIGVLFGSLVGYIYGKKS
ncbi:hypothetical protein VIBNISFn27_600001 [Vibrio nigripulchritudo SFn27]|uniref:Uncharacterized protein n=2 Tax=Vibrio nigripulchritudo TaxID=28173 RepID=U4KGH1_9VIBR|nr:hypothetical protein VIBNIBLFn1_360001 [Vibrio nigripulchritudo BLFn1]CCN89450.1 hypothetical protein VIBNISFn27_600001 [Vibrio nigripulchritudo SFn27]CCN95522.1 hypothetical protein VIBNIENn2_580001 [Vibrio nigripulchritudo ENn2]CCO39859.1 hypothetical protein VIBNISFn135_20001 [Vibrio nigripulchritudo SFn135]CCO53502.1 hypothetical protein VIBNIWn13_510001 [Vibrio nigripulchritudo Wn13]CCO60359.1 hypothetical protein VIBNI_B0551 [Vibrio nigripulchritudo]